MKKDKGKSAQAAELRRLAEQRLRAGAAETTKSGTKQDALRLVHELQVHQVELEMQNEELNAARTSAETALERFTDLYDFAPVGYFTLTREGHIVEVNLTGAALLGPPRPTLLRRGLGCFVARAERARWDRHLSDVLRSDAGQTCELPFLREHGSSFYARLDSIRLDRPAPDDRAGGQHQMMRVVMTDVTERKRAEEALHASERALRQVANELERSNRDLEQFATVASHDLGEPLRAVVGYASLLQERYAERLDDRARGFLQGALDGAARMQQLIDDLLALSRVGTRGAGRQLVEAEAAAGDALANLTAAIAESGAVVSCGPLPRVSADPRQLAQLFQNLIGNAIKFRADVAPRIDVGAVRQEGHWLFSVRDNGIGVDPKDRERIFEIFQRLNPRGAYPGTGIGLAICKRIVERHGGTIWIDSEPGRGATVFFTLPDREAEQS